MEKPTARLDNAFFRAGAAFKVPILSWTNKIPLRFFEALYGALNKMLYIQPSDFSAPSGQSLGDCNATLSIFGGNSTLMLKPSGIIADFPNLGPDKVDWANTVILQGYEAIRSEFSELEIDTLDATAGYHFAYSEEKRIKEILSPGEPKKQIDLTDDHGSVTVEDGLRYGLVGFDGRWNARITVERSNAVESGIFIYREIKVNKLEGYETSTQQLKLIEQIDLMIFEFAGMKTDIMGEHAD